MDVVSALEDLLGHDAVISDPDVTAGHTADWTGAHHGSTPAVVRPATVEQVAALIAWARTARVGLVPQGGNTGLVAGAVPHNGSVVVSTSRLTAITDIDADSGQLTAGAGVTIASVQAAASGAGWRYGVDFASRDSATVGGSIATNAGGLRVIRHGSTRRQVLGVEAVLGTGAVIRRLGGLWKDNTGYDLAGLLCGSEGTLGIVTAARLALVPAAGPTVTAGIGLGSVADAVRLVGRLRREVPTLEAAELVLRAGVALVAEQTGRGSPVDAPVVLVVEAVGPPDPTADLAAVLETAGEVIDVVVATDATRAADLWHAREAHTESIARLGVPRKYDVTLPASRLARFVDEIPDVVAAAFPGARTWLFGHVADGNIHVNVTGVPDEAEVVVAEVVLGRVIADGGSISAEHGIGTTKRRWLERDRGATDVAAMRAVKAALDPDRICNPGVLF